jgi:hypothetical protein
VLLDFGDTMEAEIALPRTGLTDAGKPDFATSARPVGRANRKRRLEFSRRSTHATHLAAWTAALTTVSTAPWGLKATLSIQPRGGTVRYFTSALLALKARPDTSGGFWESLENWSLRITAQ